MLFVCAAVAVAGWIHFRSELVCDTDNFYHYAHARIYSVRGIFTSDFPWVTTSLIARLHSDIWWGFHALLMPFTAAPDPVFGMRLAAAFLIVFLLIVFACALMRFRVTLPYLWPFLLLFAAPGELFSWMMLRPHVLSMALAALLLSLLADGRRWQAVLVSAAIASVHLTFFWVAPLVALAHVAGCRIVSGHWRWREVPLTLLGVALGCLLRPHPLNALRLEYTQIVELYALKRSGVRLLWAPELDPLPLHSLQLDFAPFLLLWAAGALVFAGLTWRRKGSEPLLRLAPACWSSLLISGCGFAIAVMQASRAKEIWVTFGVLFLALLFTGVTSGLKLWAAGRGRAIACAAAVALTAALACFSVSANDLGLAARGVRPRRLEPVMASIARHAERRAIVFHPQWWLFPELFFWNPGNRYISGMDPIFQYAADPRRYWITHRLATGTDTSTVVPGPPGSTLPAEDTYTLLRRDFGASYLVLIVPLNRPLYNFARSDRRFVLVYEDDSGSAVFDLRGGR